MRRGVLVGALAALTLTAGCSANQSPKVNQPRQAAPSRSASPAAAAPARIGFHPASWQLPAPIAREAAVVLADGRVEVAGGLLPGNQSTGNFYVLDPHTGHTSARGVLAVPVHDTAGVLVGGTPWILGGGNSSEQSVVQVISGRHAHTIGDMPSSRSDLAAVSFKGGACVVGGYDGVSVAVGEVDCSRDGRHWRRVATLPVPVRYAATVLRGDSLLVFGGESAGQMVRAVQEVDLATGRARVIARLPVPIGHQVAVPTARGIWLLGGRTSINAVTARTWMYDVAGHTFHRAHPLPEPLSDAAVAVTPGMAYVLGGETPTETSKVLVVRTR